MVVQTIEIAIVAVQCVNLLTLVILLLFVLVLCCAVWPDVRWIFSRVRCLWYHLHIGVEIVWVPPVVQVRIIED